ncbi:MAG: cytochrome c biogenesis protein CcdA [Clostridiales bacterium]|nr:redoxin domain-containing protein [Roseburia sp.]MDD7638347.1 cytochrome c biogenesis protein CcdA [Clostridiales bacterium]MDY4111342.1 cytochrome c biogenesis protein/redoxin [Roseburia sp.]
MGLSLDVSVSVITVFLQGLLSFFSPCVLPLLPLYIGYLSGGTAQVGEDGNIDYKQKKVWINTLFFVLGISFTFFLLGLGVSAMGSFFRDNRLLFTRIGAIIIIFFGLYQLGLFGKSNVLNKEHRFLLPLEKMKMSPVTAFVMGFAFSFAWTPCIGPVLTSVLLMTATARTQLAGMTLIGVYTLGFVLPFLAVGVFTTKLLALFKKHRGVVKYTVKIGAILMILMGLLMFTGKMNEVSGYLSEASAAEDSEENDVGTEETAVPAIDFELTDQYGETHTLADYKGKIIFLNFWATWCPPCRAELPDIQKLYEEYAAAGDDSVVMIGVAAPGYGGEKSAEEIAAFLEENGYTYPVLMDEGGELFLQYGVYSYPTTFMIDKDGNVFGYASGQLSEDIMRDIIRQTVEGKRD